MTDEERQKLVEHLRAGRPNQFERKAADEIERLAKELAAMKAFATTQSETIRFYMDQAVRMNGEL